MIKHLIVPTDFSTCASNAIDYAVEVAKRLEAQLTLLHAFDAGGSAYTDYMGLNREFNHSMIHEAKAKLDALREKIGDTHNMTVQTEVSELSLNETIEILSKEKEADLIIMGTVGATGIKEKLWGSNTGAVIAHSGIPVLVIPNGYEWTQPSRILFATQHFEKDPAVLDVLFGLAKKMDAKVFPAIYDNDHKDEAAILIEHGRKIETYQQFLHSRFDDRVLSAKHMYGDSLEEALQEYVDKEAIDWIAMITHKKSFLERLFNSSKTKRMSYHTHVPLLAIPVSDK